MDPLEAIRETFFQECDEQLAALESGLGLLETGAADAETVNAMFRAVHSIKGGAGAFALGQLVRFAHGFETTLDRLRAGDIVADAATLKPMLRAADLLADLVRAAREGTVFDETRIDQGLAGLAQAETGAPAPAAALSPAAVAIAPELAAFAGFAPLAISLDDLVAPARRRILFRPTPDLYAKGAEPLRLLRELARLGRIEVDCDVSAVPTLDALKPDDSWLAWSVVVESPESDDALREVFDFVVDDCELSIAPIEDAAPERVAAPAPTTTSIAPAAPLAPPPAVAAPRPAPESPSVGAPAPGPATIRVDLHRVDRLINLVGELVINQSMLSQSVARAGVARAGGVEAGLTSLEQLTRELQEAVMAARAQPVRSLFQRMTRIVREAADATGKLVRLRAEGEATEVDRTVIEGLVDPLTHILRNAVDHGLETPERRRAAGKSEQGEVRLTAAHRSGRIVIEIADDGAGIDRPKVRAIAIAKGLISPDAELTDAEIDGLLFLPGFSTASSVSNLSGRGVGMDVVKRSVQALGGRIAISSQPGRGATIALSLPLTLAVLDGIVVKVARETLVVPLTAIVETRRPKPGELRALGRDGMVLADRGGFTPIIDIGCELGFRDRPADPQEAVALLVEAEGGARAALVVDAISDQRQVVIKSLEANYRRVPGVAAATILGEGRVALILDVDALVRAGATGADSIPFLAQAS